MHFVDLLTSLWLLLSRSARAATRRYPLQPQSIKPLGQPKPDPIVQDIATRKIAEAQPYIYRITRLGQAAARRGADEGIAFAHEVSKAIWGGAENWHEGDHLARAATAAGLAFDELEAEAAAQPQELDAEIAANQQALEEAGHWGVPCLVFEGEPLFGQDRIEVAQWRMEQKGLEAR